MNKCLGIASASHNHYLTKRECLHHFFEAQAEMFPENIALICAEQSLTYRELEHQSNQLALFLRSQGVVQGSRVGMLLERSLNVPLCVLAILKAGATYIPLDPEYPSERIHYILEDAGAQALVTTTLFSDKYSSLSCNILCIDQNWWEIVKQSGDRLQSDQTGVSDRDLCYIIYTSGSTGKPKGVEIEHRSACNFVKSASTIYGVTAADRVYQGFSIAFDASVEEVWITFAAGATLVIGTAQMVRSGPALPKLLTDYRVTVLSCVPTLLSMMDEDIPTIRLLILGGEQCPVELVSRWSKPDRRILNTYGPTEASVVSTWAECRPDKPITIGKPLPNYEVYILDEDRQQVPIGTTGEIYIGGISLARGYVNRRELTQTKFVPNPFTDGSEATARLYATGDLGCWTVDGDIQFMGRVDEQVKLRGFRVELSEIESVLMECSGIQSAVVSLFEPVPGIQQLVGYVVLQHPDLFDRAATQTILRSRLPHYMVPACLEVLDELPTLPSGKVNRKQLPQPSQMQAAGVVEPVVLSDNVTEQKIANIWQKLFPQVQISLDSNFFLDLGGHSLLAASLVSQMREQPEFAHISMLDVYQCPTIARLAARLTQQTASPKASTATLPSYRVSRRRYLTSATIQALALIVLLFCFALQWLLPYLTYTWMQERQASNFESFILAIATLAAIIPIMLGFSVVAKWLVLGRVKPGQYRLWGNFYLRWWFVKNLLYITPIHFLSGTPLLNFYYRLLGAKIGTNVYLSAVDINIPDLVSIGADSSIGYAAKLANATVEQGWLKIGCIDIGDRCFVGASAVLSENTVMEADTSLEDLSMLPPQQRIIAGEVWAGSPAAKVGTSEQQNIPHSPRLRRIYFGTLQAILLMTLPVLELVPIIPGVEQMYSNSDEAHWLLFSPLIALSFVIFMTLQIVILKWLIVGRVKPGSCRLDSHRYLRLWYVDKLMELSLNIIRPLYATLYLLPWYRLLGAKLGWRAEIATPSSLIPDLVTIGSESFIADGVVMGVPRVERGRMYLLPTRVGERSFIGNSALLPAGVTIGDETLIGCMSTPPFDTTQAAQRDTAWFGSPGILLPQRQIVQGFSVESTYKPSLGLVLQRMGFEAVRVLLPLTCTLILSSLLIDEMLSLDVYYDEWALLLFLPFLYLGFGLVAVLITVVCKWLIVGRYQPTEHPLWSRFVFQSELITCLHETLAVSFLVDILRGTPFINSYLRLMGCKIGKRVYTDTTDMTEFDTIDVGDDVALNSNCGLQTHLFEDRVMKISTVKIGNRCSVGSAAIVLYDTVMEPDSSLGNLSMLMKGESLPAGSSWVGSPARTAD
ncbi:Pls/PosA family non-ribosomal peptide synthetase [Fortiea contorta]|uniref:Pls/PosA family non-ribosomal peptide synthetase n=1 Tax=Fortiea contorta TaxID=1892405 RepID=UPI00083F4845|nr:Pls/PosA family non-ribosomal peptide synthetase [Fortiea contorta]